MNFFLLFLNQLQQINNQTDRQTGVQTSIGKTERLSEPGQSSGLFHVAKYTLNTHYTMVNCLNSTKIDHFDSNTKYR